LLFPKNYNQPYCEWSNTSNSQRHWVLKHKTKCDFFSCEETPFWSFGHFLSMSKTKSKEKNPIKKSSLSLSKQIRDLQRLLQKQKVQIWKKNTFT
jgi:hypothetical protein